MHTRLPSPDPSAPAVAPAPHWAARPAVPVGAAMSWPAWVWPVRASPYTPVTVPETGVAILPAPHPPADCTGVLGAAAGVVGAALGCVVAARLVAASVDVELGDGVVFGVVVFGDETVCSFGAEVEGAGPSSAEAPGA